MGSPLKTCRSNDTSIIKYKKDTEDKTHIQKSLSLKFVKGFNLTEEVKNVRLET